LAPLQKGGLHPEVLSILKHAVATVKKTECLITCADSQIVPNLITNSEPDQLFILRNVGNIIPCYGTSNNGELAAVEYAVVELGIVDLIVCGHTCCGAMGALVN
jgi:carbonic anhydrase